ncbi:CPBP family intramembrane glutamic endopeptidase [Desertihabitans aurantiacus]|uniref:CPBP family intramembrane glutamic endopeptidase n=1 Tax=Desertihabitans aurantiacus TaxID=2282477 RepID=UPI000DF80F58|nr:CPBP family intramembrane glutamic endopeptidase [Desertihabitans aurantiacus]
MSADLPTPAPPTPPTTGPAASGPVTRGSRAGAPEPLPYHLLARTRPGHRWRTLLVVLLAAALWLGACLLLLAFDAATRRVLGLDLVARILSTDFTDPVGFIGGFGIVALMLPASLVAQRLLGARPTGLLSSVTGRLRWRWLLHSLALVLGVQLVVLTVDIVVLTPLLGGEVPAPVLQPWAWFTLLGAVLLVPVQSAAEEYAFRGLLMQLVGSWLRHPAFAIVLPVPVFALGHGYDLWGALDVAVAGLAAGWVAWRTGGLEAAIALHVVNNVTITVLTAVGWADPAATSGSPLGLALSLAGTTASLWLVTRAADRAGVQRRRPALPTGEAVAVG